MVRLVDTVAGQLANLREFNQNHDARGRFAAHGSLAGIEAEIAAEPGTEHAFVVGPDGSVLVEARQQGDPGEGYAGRVHFTSADEAKMAGGVLTHNHPTAQHPYADPSLSPEDVGFAIKTRLAEIRAVTPDGKVYSMKPGPGGWPSRKEYARRVGTEIATVSNRNSKKVHDGAPGWPSDRHERVLKASHETMDEVWRSLAPALGMVYTATDR